MARLVAAEVAAEVAVVVAVVVEAGAVSARPIPSA
jgi:hypothetical protein